MPPLVVKFCPVKHVPIASQKAKVRAPGNRTIIVNDDEVEQLRRQLVTGDTQTDLFGIQNAIVCGDAFDVLKTLPSATFDLLFADPPYNLTKGLWHRTVQAKNIRQLRRLARIVADAVLAAVKTNCFHLHLR